MKLNSYLVVALLLLWFIYPKFVLADVSKITKVGNAPEDKKPKLTSGVKDLVDKIIASEKCTVGGSKGVIISGNVGGCVNSVDMSKIASSEIKTSANTYANLQCVGFVKASIGESTDSTLNDRGVGNAKDYAIAPPVGFRFYPKDSSSAQIGDIAIWGGTSTGHVAFVIDVDSRAFSVAEANWGEPGGNVKNNRVVDKNDTNFLGWVRKNE